LAADPNDHALSILSLTVTAVIGAVSIIRQRRRDRDDRQQAEQAAVTDSLDTIGTLAVDIAKEIVAGTDDLIAAHRSEVAAELASLRAHVEACDRLTAEQATRIEALTAALDGR
jgi:hypothetical protein